MIPYYLHNKSEEHIIEGDTFYAADLSGSIDELKGKNNYYNKSLLHF